MAQGCRTCLKILETDSSIYHGFQSSSSPDNISLKDKLADCIPDLLLESVDNNVMCNGCFKQLESSYAFKQKCIESQDKIYGYLQQLPMGTELNVCEIAMYYNRLKTVENDLPDNLITTDVDDKVDVGTTTDDLYKIPSFEDISSLEEEEEPDLTEMPDEDKEFDDRKRSISSLNSLDEYDNTNRTVITPYECTLCEFSCLTVSGYRVHAILHKGEIPPFKCDECTAFLSDKKELLEHVAEHTKETSYICKRCDYVTSSKLNYIKHKNAHRKSKEHAHRCNECKVKFRSSEKLKLHCLDVHTKKKHIFHCHLCKYVCTSKEKLQSHLDSAQNHGESQLNELTGPKCKLCNLEFNNLAELKLHRKRHNTTKNEQTKCTICWWQCKTRGDLKLHVKLMHKTCRICCSTFASHVALKTHLRETFYHQYDQF